MDVKDALHQLSQIHLQITKSEYFRGFRSIPLILSGLSGFIAALGQSIFMPEPNAIIFSLYWATIATINVILLGVTLFFEQRRSNCEQTKSQFTNICWQFMPPIFAGALLTDVALRLSMDILFQLPGLWSLLFALSYFASRPFLPTKVVFVGFYYLLASILLFFKTATFNMPSAWTMALVFGCGQLFFAAIIYWELERNHDRK